MGEEPAAYVTPDLSCDMPGSNQDLIWRVKIGVYVGFCVPRGF